LRMRRPSRRATYVHLGRMQVKPLLHAPTVLPARLREVLVKNRALRASRGISHKWRPAHAPSALQGNMQQSLAVTPAQHVQLGPFLFPWAKPPALNAARERLEMPLV
jgi:hypothetical protein